jgi:hypothetical protein
MCAVLLFLGGYLHATELPAPVTLDLPIPANLATPSWLGHPETPSSQFAALNLPILTPDPTASLLVTVYFEESPGGYLRVLWNGTQGAQMLTQNFYEDISMPNQRSLLISPDMLVGDGTLTFQSSTTTLGIQRIKLEWLSTQDGLVSPSVKDTLVTPSVGSTQLAQSLNGQATTTEPGAWENQIVTVPMTDHALRIEDGVEFSVDLDKVPSSARLSLKETGLPLGKHFIVWINQQRAGTFTPSVPSLLDGGYMTHDKAATNYVGWRDGSFYVPVSLLKSGVNAIQLSDEDDAPAGVGTTSDSNTGTGIPVAAKEMVLQLNYFTPDDKATFLAPQLSLVPASTTSTSETTSTTTANSNP